MGLAELGVAQASFVIARAGLVGWAPAVVHQDHSARFEPRIEPLQPFLDGLREIHIEKAGRDPVWQQTVREGGDVALNDPDRLAPMPVEHPSGKSRRVVREVILPSYRCAQALLNRPLFLGKAAKGVNDHVLAGHAQAVDEALGEGRRTTQVATNLDDIALDTIGLDQSLEPEIKALWLDHDRRVTI